MMINLNLFIFLIYFVYFLPIFSAESSINDILNRCLSDDARVFISLDHHNDGSFLQNPSLADLVVLDRKFKLKKALTCFSGSED